jgi:hypothetical protein
MKKTKIPITERAVLQRINRKLKRGGEMVRTNRRVANAFGRGEMPCDPLYHVIDIQRNFITGQLDDIDALEEYGREIGVLMPWERLQS